MIKSLEEFIYEVQNIKSLLQVWNSHKQDRWFYIRQDQYNGTVKIILTPNNHDYFTNGCIEDIERIVNENSKLSYHTYHVGVTTHIVDTSDGHMITALSPEIVLNFYEHETSI